MARSATIEPILPQPMMPSVLPVISTPMNLFFSHLPACVEASAWGICRASDSISVMACSAVVIELPNGVFITMMRSEEHTSELQSRPHLVCRLLLEKKKKNICIIKYIKNKKKKKKKH